MRTLVESVRWRRSQIAETFPSVRVSAPSYRFAEDVSFVPIVEIRLLVKNRIIPSGDL